MSRVFQGSRALMAAKSAAVVAEKSKNMGGIRKLVPVSPALKNFTGVSEISRAQAIKMIWDHIKSNNLQNPANKREICCDDKLKSIFDGRENVGMLEISRLLSPHFLKANCSCS